MKRIVTRIIIIKIVIRIRIRIRIKTTLFLYPLLSLLPTIGKPSTG